jgi:hypothetical protein
MTMEEIKPLVTKDKNWIMKINQAWYASLINVHKNRLRKSMPIKINVMLMAQIKTYFQVPSSASLLRW